MAFREDAPTQGLGLLGNHREKTAELHQLMECAVWAVHYDTLPHAISDALEKKRPLILKPGATYTLSEPLVVSNIRRFRLIGNGATLKATADMDMLLDLNGIADSRISDLDLTTADNVTVTDMVRYRWQEGVGRSSTRNDFQHIYVSGDYVNGWHVGDGSRQVDISQWQHCTCAGGWTAGEDTLWQTGFLLGEGLHGNGMLTSFYSCVGARHRNHWRINGYRYVKIGDGCNGSFAECDVISNATRPVTISGYRSEHSAMLFKADAGAANYPMMHTIQDVGFHTTPEDMGDNRAVVDVNYGGYLALQNITATGMPDGSVLVRSHDLNKPLHVDVTGAVLEGVAPEDAFDLDANTTLRSFGVQQINDIGAIVEDA